MFNRGKEILTGSVGLRNKALKIKENNIFSRFENFYEANTHYNYLVSINKWDESGPLDIKSTWTRFGYVDRCRKPLSDMTEVYVSVFKEFNDIMTKITNEPVRTPITSIMYPVQGSRGQRNPVVYAPRYGKWERTGCRAQGFEG